MKLLSLIVLCLSFSAFAKSEKMASLESIIDVGVNEHQVCTRLNDDNLKLECFKLTSRYYFDQSSLNFCDKLDSAYETINCLRALANNNLDAEAARVCARINDDAEAVRCASASVNRYYSSITINFCDKLQNAQVTTSCMGVVGGSNMQADAANAFMRINDDYLKLQCGTTILNRRYGYEHVRFCDSLQTAEATISCFQD